MKLTDEDEREIQRIRFETQTFYDEREAIALHFLHEGIRRSLEAISTRQGKTPWEAVHKLLTD